MYFLSLMIFFFCFFFLTSISLATRIAELEPLPLRIAAAMSSACCTRVVVADGFPIKYLAEGGEGRRLFWIFLVSARASLAVYFLLLLLLRSLMLSNEKHSIFLVRLAASKDAAAILEAILKELVSMSMLLLLLLPPMLLLLLLLLFKLLLLLLLLMDKKKLEILLATLEMALEM